MFPVTGLGGWYSYRMSKSALNMATRNLSIELRRRSKGKVICIALHPGTVNTDLSRPYHRNVPKEKLFSTLHSVECMMAVISKLTLMDSGKYFAFDGTEIPFWTFGRCHRHWSVLTEASEWELYWKLQIGDVKFETFAFDWDNYLELILFLFSINS